MLQCRTLKNNETIQDVTPRAPLGASCGKRVVKAIG